MWRKLSLKKAAPKIAILLVLAVAFGLFFYFDLGRFLTLAELQNNLDGMKTYYAENPLQVVAYFMAIYIAVTALSLPGAAIMTLAGGAIFDLFLGTVLVSFASTTGATLAFLTSRFMLGTYVQEKFGDKLEAINKGVQEEGAFYLFALRLVPAFPFFVINLVMGLTPIKTPVFFFVSQIGMLAGTIVYVNAGAQLAKSKIDSLAGILTPEVILSFVVLGIFPIIAKKLLAFLRRKKSAAS